MTDSSKKIASVTLDGINIASNPLRPLIEAEVKRLAVSMQQIGMMNPITVRYHENIPSSDNSDDSYELVSGRHRVAAARSLGWDEIDAIEIECSDVDAKLWEIAENLHRAELTKLQHDEQLAMWIKLTENKLAQSAPVISGGRGHTGGARAASRDLGIDRDAASRAIKVASLSDEAKDAAREHGLDDNRSAMLEAARETEPAAQVAKLVGRANRPPVQTSAPDADKQRENEAKYKAIAQTIIDRFSTDDIRFLLHDVRDQCCCENCLSQVFIETEAGQNAPAPKPARQDTAGGHARNRSPESDDDDDNVAAPEQIEDNVLYAIARVADNARAVRKILKASALNRKAAERVIIEINLMIQKWRLVLSTLEKKG
jgi:ParB/RepB/Spo0J family partition protein